MQRVHNRGAAIKVLDKPHHRGHRTGLPTFLSAWPRMSAS
jgi:hypothetical protein